MKSVESSFSKSLVPTQYEQEGISVDIEVLEDLRSDFLFCLVGKIFSVHNLPIFSMTVSVSRLIGNRLGSFLEVAQGDEGDGVSRCLRIRVKVDATKTLWRDMNISFSDIVLKWVDFTYERLPEFCHDCGNLEHWTLDCSWPSMDIRVGGVKPLNSTLHATLEPFGGPRFSDRRTRDRSINFPDLVGLSCDEDCRRIETSSVVAPEPAVHNTAVSCGYLDLSPSSKELRQLHGLQGSQKPAAVSLLPTDKLEAQVSMSTTSTLRGSAQMIGSSDPISPFIPIPASPIISPKSISPSASNFTDCAFPTPVHLDVDIGSSSISRKGWNRSVRLKGTADSNLPLTDVTNTINPLGGFPDVFNQGSLQIKCPKKIKVPSPSSDDKNVVDAAELLHHEK
ncbi:unnamed protein product [Prunus brigantina]